MTTARTQSSRPTVERREKNGLETEETKISFGQIKCINKQQMRVPYLFLYVLIKNVSVTIVIGSKGTGGKKEHKKWLRFDLFFFFMKHKRLINHKTID